MTIEQNRRCAINYLNELKASTNGYGSKWLDIAIKVLEQQPCEDCISREAAIEIVYPYVDGDLIADDIKRLPSVTPRGGVTITDFADRCRECSRINLCEDHISRYEINDDTDDDSLLTSDERAYILTLITKMLQANNVNLEVAGYEDCDGVYFNIMLDKADENKPAVGFQHADSSKLPEGWEATT